MAGNQLNNQPSQNQAVNAPTPLGQQQQLDTFYVSFIDGIDNAKVQQIMTICSNILDQYNPLNIYFMISSGGGDVDAGIALYNFLKALPVQIVMHNIGTIDSIANVVFLAGDERYASSHTSFLFHGVTWGFGAGASLNLNQIREVESRLKISQNKIAGIICRNTSITNSQITRLFKQGKTEGVSFALDKGIISEERDAQIPIGAPSASINLVGIQ